MPKTHLGYINREIQFPYVKENWVSLFLIELMPLTSHTNKDHNLA